MVQFSLKAVVATIFAAASLIEAADVSNGHHLERRCTGKRHQPGAYGTKHHHEPKKTHHAASTSNSSGKGIVAAYVTDWALPSEIAWSKLDHVFYAFAIPTKDGSLGSFDAGNLQKVVKDAHANQKKVSLSVGGWTGSLYFSDLVLTTDKRSAFADNLVKAVTDYDLDGIDIDWEYPNNPNGVACNAINDNDTANFLSLMTLLRQKLGSGKTLSAAVATTPFNDASQNPEDSLDAKWGSTLDYINIMVYDLAGSWNPKTGANSPLYSDADDSASVDSAVTAWTGAGFPANKILVGVPFYGFVTKVKTAITASTGEHVAFDTSAPQIQGDQYDTKGADPCPGATATYSGEFQYRSIVEEGVSKNSSGWANYWDSKTMTPYAFNKDKMYLLTYDNPASLTDKANYAVKKNLGGLMMWSLEMDTSSNDLLNAMQAVRA
ncbi:glycoside hydrolase superfamily [Gongronella butleri]|nr:glycoside hydrolase superfamily [Gongronella butleri]